MMGIASDRTLRSLTGWLGIAVVVELVLLRTGTRTLVHIPGLGRFDVSIGVLSEVGRLAYYLALVLVVSTSIYLGWRCWNTGTTAGRLVGGFVWSFIVVALLGRLETVPAATVAWLSLGLMVGVVAVTWGGARSIPVVLFVAASAIASWSVLGQGAGGGLSGQTVDVTIVVAEALLLLAGASAPLLVRGRTTRVTLAAGLATVVVVAAGFSVGGSTLAILTLWNLGVPGWFPPVAYGLAFGSVVVTVCSALANRLVLTAVAVVLLVAGGVGPISTYQTALALTAMILIGITGPDWGLLESRDQPESRDESSVGAARDLIPLS